MKEREIKINSKTIYQGKVIEVVLDEVMCPNGVISKREIVKHLGGAAILGITKENKVILERQYRYAFDQVLYEIPAGKIEKGEKPQTTAIREFEEETGYKPKNMHSLGEFFPTVGYSSEVIYLFYTDDFYQTKTSFDDDESILIEEHSFEEILKMIKNGLIKDGKTICAVYNYLFFNNKLIKN